MPTIQKDIPLKPYSNLKIGGSADYFVTVESQSDLTNALHEWKEISKNLPLDRSKIFILGSGTNVLIGDEGFRGLVILNKIGGIESDGTNVEVSSGVEFSRLLDFCIEKSLTGLEWAGGLPGTVGGAVRGNAGAFVGETKDVVSKVTSIDFDNLTLKTREKDQLNFSYRNSVFKSDEGRREFILKVWFSLKSGDKDQIKKQTQEKIDFRMERHPMDLPNIGSTFKNIPKENVPQALIEKYQLPVKDDPFPIVPTAKLLSLAGLKGKRVGGAQVSEKHPNFIVNVGSATSKDVLDLMELEREEIRKKFGLELEEEILIL